VYPVTILTHGCEEPTFIGDLPDGHGATFARG